jgi:Tfp pilus assembly protein PilZ
MTIKADRRNWSRLDKIFPVLVESPLFGFKNCIARNISSGGIFLETQEPLPLGSAIRVYFALADGCKGISAAGHVKNHYYLNYGSADSPSNVTGMGVRFTKFDADGADQLSETLRRTLQ